ncbi:hypothetical protein, partial [Nonomuraea salmonea]
DRDEMTAPLVMFQPVVIDGTTGVICRLVDGVVTVATTDEEPRFLTGYPQDVKPADALALIGTCDGLRRAALAAIGHIADRLTGTLL